MMHLATWYEKTRVIDFLVLKKDILQHLLNEQDIVMIILSSSSLILNKLRMETLPCI
jgi:hypothetical protein